MSSQRESVEQVFEAALALDPKQRDAFLDERCGDDSELRAMVDRLLAEDARAGSFLEHPLLEFLEGAAPASPPVAETAQANHVNWGPPAGTCAAQLKPGQILIDRFVVVRFIAKGGMGEVYEAEDRFLSGVHVALKTILPHVAADSSLQQRFKSEVLLAREVSHPNLCPIYDIFRCEQPPPGFLFLTMKLLPGTTLAARLRSGIPIDEGLAILRGTAAGIAAIHAAGIVHRDIKPSNLMLDGAGAGVRVWITDFGLARAFEAEPSFPDQATLAGTPAYIAPELLAGHSPSQASDLYAFGILLHEIFTGKKPAISADGSSAVVSPALGSSSAPASCIQLIRGLLDKDPKHRCEAFDEAREQLGTNARRPWTRRQFIGAAAAGVCSAGALAWWKRDSIEDILHPLPSKRFVALLNWPKTSDSRIAPMLEGALNAIRSELARLEVFDRNLFVISPEDAEQRIPANAHLREICDPLGANLALTAFGVPGSKHLQLILRLLNPSSDKSIREREVTCSFSDPASLPGKAVQAAARLLDVNRFLQVTGRTEAGTQSPAAYNAFQSAESLIRQPNDTGLDAAIDKYKEAIQLDPNYAIAHAELAQAYVHLYGIRHDPGALDLARGNSDRSLALDRRLVDGYLARAVLFEQTGNEQGALEEFSKALALDPSNPDTLRLQAGIYTRLNRWADAEKTYNLVVKERPNSWVAYNQLGFVLHEQGKYRDAIRSFRAASLAAPKSTMALTNLGAEYIQVGEFTEATDALKKSMSLHPSDFAAATMSLALRCQSRYQEALPFALKAVELNPSEDANWLELGDCYSSLPNRRNESRNAYRRAALETQRHLQTDPANGANWMMLALYRTKSGSPKTAPALMQKAESLGAGDMDSQISKARTLELLGKRDEALATLAACFRKGATSLQIVPFPDMQSLRKDPRYRQMLQPASAATEAN